MERFAAGSAQTEREAGWEVQGCFDTSFVLYASDLLMGPLQSDQLADFIELPLVSDESIEYPQLILRKSGLAQFLFFLKCRENRL